MARELRNLGGKSSRAPYAVHAIKASLPYRDALKDLKHVLRSHLPERERLNQALTILREFENQHGNLW